MPTVHCKRTDCQHIGDREDICIRRNIDVDEDGCRSYEAIAGLIRVRSPNCHSKADKYKSNRVNLIK